MIINPLRVIVAISAVAMMVIVTKQMSEAIKNIKLSRSKEVSVEH